MNIRMQVTIPEDDHSRAAAKATASGMSLAEYLRRLVRQDLDEEPAAPAADLRELFGIGDSGGSDVARHKQAYLSAALAPGKSSHALRR